MRALPPLPRVFSFIPIRGHSRLRTFDFVHPRAPQRKRVWPQMARMHRHQCASNVILAAAIALMMASGSHAGFAVSFPKGSLALWHGPAGPQLCGRHCQGWSKFPRPPGCSAARCPRPRAQRERLLASRCSASTWHARHSRRDVSPQQRRQDKILPVTTSEAHPPMATGDWHARESARGPRGD